MLKLTTGDALRQLAETKTDFARLIEKNAFDVSLYKPEKIDPRGVRRKNGEIDSQTVPCRAEWKWPALPNRDSPHCSAPLRKTAQAFPTASYMPRRPAPPSRSCPTPTRGRLL